MNKQNRRSFLQISTGALATGLSPMRTALSHGVRSGGTTAASSRVQVGQRLPENEGKKPLRLGLILGIGRDPGAAMAKVHELGLPTCQVFVDEVEPELAGRPRQGLDKYRIDR